MVENKYKVYVCCNTYNHAAYITDALNGFVMQETNFPFVVCVIDDASTDGEQAVIRQYVNKNFDTDNPDVAYQRETDYAEITFTQHKTNKNCFLVVHYLKYNHYQHNISMRSYLDEWRNDSEYIALCEGDDYWTDPLKLQKQVDFLDINPDYVLCTHYYTQYFQENSRMGDVLPTKLTGGVSFTLNDYITYKYWYTQPLTSIARTNIMNQIASKKYNNFKDAAMFFMILSFGKGYLHPDNMGVYRIQGSGIWSSASRQERIASDLKTMKGLYDVERNAHTATYIYNFMYRTGYLGVSFYRKYIKLYFDIIFLLFKTKGLKAFIIVYKSLNIFAR